MPTKPISKVHSDKFLHFVIVFVEYLNHASWLFFLLFYGKVLIGNGFCR